MENLYLAGNCPRCGSPDVIFTEKEDQRYWRCKSCQTVCKRNPTTNQLVMADYQICDRCGTLNRLQDKFCKQCGLTLLINCPNCNRLIDVAAKFCPDCKANIKKLIARKKSEEEKRYLQNFKTQLGATEARIGFIQNKITETNLKRLKIRSLSRRLYYFGKIFLLEESRELYDQFNSEIGCIFRGLINFFAFLIFRFVFRNVIESIKPNFFNYATFQVFMDVDMYVWLNSSVGYSLLAGFLVAHLFVAVANIFYRLSIVDKLLAPHDSSLMGYEKELNELQEKKNHLEEKLAYVKNP